MFTWKYIRVAIAAGLMVFLVGWWFCPWMNSDSADCSGPGCQGCEHCEVPGEPEPVKADLKIKPYKLDTKSQDPTEFRVRSLK